MTFTSPSAALTIIARPLWLSGSSEVTTSRPASLACSSDIPVKAASGWRVDAPRHLAVVDRGRVLAEDSLDREHALGEPDVGERRRGDGVADAPDAVLAGATALVDLDEALVGDRPPWCRRASRSSVLGRRPTETTTTSASTGSPSSNCTVVPPSRGSWPVTVDAGADVDAPLLERSLDDLGDVGVEPGEDLGQHLEDRHLGAQVAHHRGELAADDSPADDDRALRHLGHRQDLVGGHDQGAVDVEAGIVRGTEPGARITASAVISTSPELRR